MPSLGLFSFICKLGWLSWEVDGPLLWGLGSRGPWGWPVGWVGGGPWSSGSRWALSWGLCPQSLIVPGKSPTRKKSGPFGSRRSSAIGIENIQEVQEKRWVERQAGWRPSPCPAPLHRPPFSGEGKRTTGRSQPSPLLSPPVTPARTLEDLLCASSSSQAPGREP